MNEVPAAQSDWRDSLHALNSLNGFKFVVGKQIHRASHGPKLQEGLADTALHEMAAGGNPLAMEQLGKRLLQGDCGSETWEQGVHWLQLSAAAGNPVAMHWVAEHLLATDAAARAGEAQALLERAIAADFLPAQVALGAHLLEGSLPPDATFAVKLLREAAARGSRLAHVVLAACHISGWGVPIDRDAGVGWLRRLGATTPKKLGGLASHLYSRALASPAAERRRLSKYAAAVFGESIRRGNLDDEMNLAYLIRRGEVPEGGLPSLDALLERHLMAGAAHALMNQALRLARGVDCTVDWRAADALVARVDDPDTLLSWWRPRAVEGDAEGHLVIGWLARHSLCANPVGITAEARFDAARTGNWEVPDWLYTQAA